VKKMPPDGLVDELFGKCAAAAHIMSLTASGQSSLKECSVSSCSISGSVRTNNVIILSAEYNAVCGNE